MSIIKRIVFLAILTGLMPESNGMVLENPSLRLEISIRGQVVSFVSPVGGKKQWVMPEQYEAPFSITFQKYDGKQLMEKIFVANGIKNPFIEYMKSSGKKKIVLRWDNLKLEGASGDFAVTGVISLDDTSMAPEWKIIVDNRVDGWGIQSVTFPRLVLNASDKPMLAVPKPGLGRFYNDPAAYNGEKIERFILDSDMGGIYPSADFTMQFLALTSANESLYLATHDPQGKGKEFQMRPIGDNKHLLFSVTHWPEAPMRSPYRWESSYPVVIALVRGDWWHCCRIYRQWAYASAAWSQYPLSRTPEQLPDWWIKASLWDHPYYKKDNAEGRRSISYIKEFQKSMDGQRIIVMYAPWAWIGFDTNYPDLFPPRKWFIQDVADALKSDIHYHPYINGTDANTDGSYWVKGGYVNRIVNSPKESQSFDYAHPGSQMPQPIKWGFAKMCPHTQWKETISQLAGLVVSELRVDGLYIDVLNSSKPYPCYATDHQHALGNRSDWPIAYRELVRHCRMAAYKTNPDVIFSSEGACEAYGIESPLMTNETARNMNCPMLMAVYADRIDPYGYDFPEDEYLSDPMAWRSKLAEMFIYGMKLGIQGHGKSTGKPEIISMLKKLASLRTTASKYLSIGEMMHPPLLEGDNPTLDIPWISAHGHGQGSPKAIIKRDTVRASSWLAADGTAALAFVNIANRPMTLTWKAKVADLGISTASCYKVSGIETIPDNGWIMGTITIPAMDAVILQIVAEDK